MIGLPAPKGWATATLGEVADIERKSITPDEIQPGTQYLGLEHLDGSGRIIAVQTVKNGDLASNKFLFGPEHILYGKLRPYLCKIVRPGFSGICSTDILPIRGRAIVQGYLYHYLRHPRMVEFATARCEGANLPRLSPTELEKFPLHFPTKQAEQQRIADILDKADAIRRKRCRAIDGVDEFIQATFLELVGPGSSDYRSWPLMSIQQLARPEAGSMRTGPFGSDLRHSEFVSSGVAVLGIDNAVQNRFAWAERRYITEEKYKDLVRYTVYPNDVIITIMGTNGRSAVVPEEVPTAITTKHLACITLNRVLAEPEFVSNAIHRHPAVLGQIGVSHRGAIMPGLNLNLIKSLQLHVPPINVQTRFSECMRQVRSYEEQLVGARDESEVLFQSLVQRAFRGEL
jgi:type I restriction enzyme S subunit